MAKWKNVRLGDIVKIQQTTCAFGGDKVWLLNLDMIEQNTGKIIDYYYTNTFGNSTIAFDEEHVLYSKLRPNLNKVVCPNGKGFATSELLPLLPNKEYITKEYLAEYLRSSYFVEWAVSKTAGAKMPRLAPKELMNKSIPLPDLETQRKIASNLDKVTHTIDLCNAILEKLDLLVKSRFVEMFGEPVSNPMGWEKVAIGKRCDIVTGNTPPRADAENYGEYIEWIKSDNINTPDTFLTTAEEYLSEKGASIGRCVDAGGVLMTCIAGSIKCIGNVGVADRKVAFNQQINAIVPKADDTMYIYWLMILSKPYIQSTINMALKGILSKGQLSEMVFPFPPLSLQEQFAAFVKQTDKSKSVVKKLLEKAETLKKALMQEYFG